MKSIPMMVILCVLAQGVTAGGLDTLRDKHGVANSVAQVTPTLCALCGVPAPKTCEVGPIPEVLALADGQKLDKVLVFCPDAIGTFLVEPYAADFRPLLEETDVTVTGANALPSVTPVCFGSIFTGASPEVHGIRQYNDKYKERPIVVDTLFDAFSEAGKKVVIISSKGCSIDLIFRGHKTDYITTANSNQSVETAKRLLRESDYDLILCYDGNYDSVMHARGVHHPQSLAAMRDSIRWYLELVALTDEVWAGENRIAVFAPDHGAHDNAQGHGTHGTDMADDAVVNHYYRVRKARR